MEFSSFHYFFCAYPVDKDPECSYFAEGTFTGGELEINNLSLIAASAEGNMDKVVTLIKKGANLNYVDYSGDRMSPLTWASRCNHLAIVEYLISNGADVNLSVSFSKGFAYKFKDSSAIIWAVSNSHAEIIKYLISKGAIPNKREKIYEILDEIGNERFLKEGRNAFDASQNPDVIKLLKPNS